MTVPMRTSILIRLISDVHLEERGYIPAGVFPDSEPVDFDIILILAGDIGDPFAPLFKEFLLLAKSKYNTVLFVPGNHEYYNLKVSAGVTRVESDQLSRNVQVKSSPVRSAFERAKAYSMVEVEDQMHLVCTETGCIYLQERFFVYRNYTFVGATLWPHISNATAIAAREQPPAVLNYIRYETAPMTIRDLNYLHKRQLFWLRRTLDRTRNDTVLITHYPPSSAILDFRLLSYPLGNLFTVDQAEDLILPPVKAWFAGHVHITTKICFNDIPLMLNAIGRPPECQNDHYQNNFNYLLE
jgi:hypothetical protein